MTLLACGTRSRTANSAFEIKPARQSPNAADTSDLEVMERQAIERVMREVHGNKARASRQLGISRMHLNTHLRKHGLEQAFA